MPTTMEKTDMFLFSEEDAKTIVESVGAKAVRTKIGECETFKVMLTEKMQAHCEACHEPITFNNLGHIAKGSEKFYCDRPACFTHFIANNRIR